MTRAAVLLVLAAALPARAAEIRGRAAEFRGTLICGVLPGYTTRDLPSPLVIQADGGRLSYRHAALDWQNIPMPDDHQEAGTGAVSAGRVSLQGRAPGNATWSYTARYDGTLQGGVMRLGGTQHWTGTGLGDGRDRVCRAELLQVGG